MPSEEENSVVQPQITSVLNWGVAATVLRWNHPVNLIHPLWLQPFLAWPHHAPVEAEVNRVVLPAPCARFQEELGEVGPGAPVCFRTREGERGKKKTKTKQKLHTYQKVQIASELNVLELHLSGPSKHRSRGQRVA